MEAGMQKKMTKEEIYHLVLLPTEFSPRCLHACLHACVFLWVRIAMPFAWLSKEYLNLKSISLFGFLEAFFT